MKFKISRLKTSYNNKKYKKNHKYEYTNKYHKPKETQQFLAQNNYRSNEIKNFDKQPSQIF